MKRKFGEGALAALLGTTGVALALWLLATSLVRYRVLSVSLVWYVGVGTLAGAAAVQTGAALAALRHRGSRPATRDRSMPTDAQAVGEGERDDESPAEDREQRAEPGRGETSPVEEGTDHPDGRDDPDRHSPPSKTDEMETDSPAAGEESAANVTASGLSRDGESERLGSRQSFLERHRTLVTVALLVAVVLGLGVVVILL